MAISIVIPLYNKVHCIERTLRSVLRQNDALWKEAIIVDDGSMDSGAEIVEQLSIEDGRIKLIRQANAGVSVARNTGIECASGEYVALLDADDQWQPWFLDEVVSLIEAFPQADVYCTAYDNVVESGQVFRPRFSHVPEVEIGLIHRYLCASASSSNAPISSSSVCINRSALLAVGGFPEGMSQAEDKLTWAKLSLEYNIAWSPRSSMLRDMANENQSSGTWTPASANEYTAWLRSAIAGQNSNRDYSVTERNDLKLALLAQREIVFHKAVLKGFYGYALRAFLMLCFNAPVFRIPKYAAILCLPQSLKARVKKYLSQGDAARST